MTDPAGPANPDDFNLFDHAVQSDPYPLYRTLHATCPVWKVPQTGHMLVAGYDELRAMLRDTGTYSSVLERSKLMQRGDNATILLDILRARGWEHVQTLALLDPPQHTRHRKIIDLALGPRRVRTIVPRIEALARELIGQFIDHGTCDFIEEFAIPFPGIIIAEQVGLDASEYMTFRTWSETLLSYSTRQLSPDEMRAAAETELEMQHYLADIFADRRANPRDDLMSAMVAPPQDGDAPLSMHELQNLMHTLISGGYETVTSAIAHMMWSFIRFPDIPAELRADPGLIRNFVEEGLRWESPTQGLWRKVRQDTELGGVALQAGNICMPRFGAANRDPKKFPDPDRFDPHRDNASQHLSFGTGVHFCPGAMLARTELAIACAALLDAMEDFSLARPLPDPVHKPAVNFIPLRELHVAFRKRTP